MKKAIIFSIVLIYSCSATKQSSTNTVKTYDTATILINGKPTLISGRPSKLSKKQRKLPFDSNYYHNKGVDSRFRQYHQYSK